MNILIIAEIGMTHDGSFGQAKALIQAASECGVDAVKFQTHISGAETLQSAPSPPYFNDETRYEYFKRTAFNIKQYDQLKQFSKQCGVEFISSPFSIEAIELLEDIAVSTYKIPSGEVNNTPYLLRLARTGKKILLSSGMSSWDELDHAVETLKTNGSMDIIVLQCTSEYPCPPEHSGLNIMLEMKKRYQLPVGFSDHTEGIVIPVAAVTIGAEVIEKHFTLSKKMYGPDAKNSATPEEMKELVEGIRVVEVALSNKVYKNKIAESLKSMKITFEKSIVAASDISAGTILMEKHIAYKKPGDGIPARNFKNLIGKKVKINIKKNTQFTWNILNDS